MKNELEGLGDRKGHDGHLAKKFLKKYCSIVPSPIYRGYLFSKTCSVNFSQSSLPWQFP